MPRTYKIGAVAKQLKLATSVLRYWETEFPQLAPLRTPTGQRMYTDDTIKLLMRLKDLLHTKGMTIEGARRLMNRRKADAAFLTEGDEDAAAGPGPDAMSARATPPDDPRSSRLAAGLRDIRDELVSIRGLLGGTA